MSTMYRKRFIDEILASEKLLIDERLIHNGSAKIISEEYRKRVCSPDVPVIDIQNVADFCQMRIDEKDPPLLNKIGIIRSPWKTSVMEFDSQYYANSRQAVCCLVMDKEDLDSNNGAGSTIIDISFRTQTSRPFLVWLYTAVACYGPTLEYENKFSVFDGSSLLGSLAASDKLDRNDPNFSEILHTSRVVLSAIAFANCKNVSTKGVNPPAPLSRKHEKRHGRPLVSYKTLSIPGFDNSALATPRTGQPEHGRALHICRGHMRFMLHPFGRQTPAQMWIHQHRRGNKVNGVVLKDYQVSTPKRSEASQ